MPFCPNLDQAIFESGDTIPQICPACPACPALRPALPALPACRVGELPADARSAEVGSLPAWRGWLAWPVQPASLALLSMLAHLTACTQSSPLLGHFPGVPADSSVVPQERIKLGEVRPISAAICQVPGGASGPFCWLWDMNPTYQIACLPSGRLNTRQNNVLSWHGTAKLGAYKRVGELHADARSAEAGSELISFYINPMERMRAGCTVPERVFF